MRPNQVPPDDLQPDDLWRRARNAGLLALLALLAGGFALRAYHAVRFSTPEGWPLLDDWKWVSWLVLFSVGGAVVLATLVVGWGLINRKRGQPRWGTALLVLLVVLFGLLVWPTPWRYTQYGCEVFQINRFIGRTTVVTKIPACEAAPPVN